MSQQQLQHLYTTTASTNSNNNHSNLPVSEVYWSLVAKADKKFSKIRDLPYYQRTRYDLNFSKVFKLYTQLWKFQQENRQKLVEVGLKRWEIGDIASRIGQLYFGQYMKTSEASYLSESYIFYEAVLTREYFKDDMFQDINIAFKQLRFLSRFLMVCLVLNRREVVYQLVNQLKMLLDDCKRLFQETDFKEWKLVVQEIVKFLKADTSFVNLRPLRYSVVLDLPPDSIPNVIEVKRKLKLRDALLCSYHPNEVKFSELTLDTFRMLQCLEWGPSGSFYQTTTAPSIGTGISQNGAQGLNCTNHSQDITDPTLPPNPRKAMLYRPSATHFLAVLSTMCEELPSDGILLIHLSASGVAGHAMSSLSHAGTMHSGGASATLSSESDRSNPISYSEGNHINCLNIGGRGSGAIVNPSAKAKPSNISGSSCIYPCDLLPFTRTPIFLVIDSDISRAFKAIAGAEKGEPVAMLLSPTASLPILAMESSRQPSGSSFTMFLAAPLQAFILLLGFTSSDIEMHVYKEVDELLSSSLNHWGSLLAKSENLNTVWAQILSDPFLRRLLLRFIFCRAVLGLFAKTSEQQVYQPECSPQLPDDFLPTSSTCQTTVSQLAGIFGATNRFAFREGIVILPENGDTE